MVKKLRYKKKLLSQSLKFLKVNFKNIRKNYTKSSILEVYLNGYWVKSKLVRNLYVLKLFIFYINEEKHWIKCEKS